MDWPESVCVFYYLYTHASCSTRKEMDTPSPYFFYLYQSVLYRDFFFYISKNMQRQCTVQNRVVSASLLFFLLDYYVWT